jgi:protein tyrosine phosphatase (PTP) superfamily phosphohydrolase (DUF442 family)
VARLALSIDVLRDMISLPKNIANKVADAYTKITDQTHAGMHLEKLAQAADARVRTIRIDLTYRGVVLAPETGDTYLLMRVLHHDDAYDWAKRNKFGVNAMTGAIEVVDFDHAVRAMDDATALVAADTKQPPIFDKFADKVLTGLGIRADFLPIIRGVSTEDQLLSLAAALPQAQGDVLLHLADGDTPEEAWAQLAPEPESGSIDVEDFDAALDRAVTSATFMTVQGPDDLLDALSKPFDVWRVFLHPTQRKIAYRPSYPKPARVTGGAGTGKTVVALHRAKHLADTLAPDQPILFTTFTRNLTNVIQRNLELLGGKSLQARITVSNVDRLAAQIVRDAEGTKPLILSDADEVELWGEAIEEANCEFDVAFLRLEWTQVILAHDLTSRDEYLRAARPGRGSRLDRRQRMNVWAAIEAFGGLQRRSGKRTFLQLSVDATGYAAARAVRPFASVIVDEAQDLHPAQWRFLRALAAEGANDMFIVGDAYQRIYGNKTTLSKVGIDIVGRSFKLRLNYRTTHEILHWATALLDGVEADDLDGGADTLQGYRSLLRGSAPRFHGATSAAAEMASLVRWVTELTEGGFEEAEIGIACRTRAMSETVRHALTNADINCIVLDGSDEPSGDRVSVSTMHRLKGLEFRAVAVVDCSRWSVPLPAAIVPENVDAKHHLASLTTERSLLFVACTRARDELLVSWSGQPSEFIVATGVATL